MKKKGMTQPQFDAAIKRLRAEGVKSRVPYRMTRTISKNQKAEASRTACRKGANR